MIAAQIPPEVANQTAIQANTGSLSFREEDIRNRLGRAARGMCISSGQLGGELNPPENKEMLISRHNAAVSRASGRAILRFGPRG